MSESPIHRACPVCERTESQPWLAKAGLRLVRCRGCGMIFANPVPAEMASGRYYDRLGVPFYLSPDKLQSDYSPVRFERELRLFRAFCPAGDVLDVGCSTGAFLYQLKTRFPGDYTVVGTDVTRAALDYAQQQGIETINQDFLNHDFGSRQFDAVTFWAVLEHLDQPRQFAVKAIQILKPRGHCFVLVPNLNSLAVRLLGSKYRYIMPDHVNYFTADSLRKFVRQLPGVELMDLRTTHFNPLVIWQDWRGSEQRVSDQDRARLLKRTTGYKRNPWLKPVQWVYAGVEWLLGAGKGADNLVAVLRKQP